MKIFSGWRMTRPGSTWSLSAALLWCAGSVTWGVAAENRLPNHSFEEGEGDHPAAWIFEREDGAGAGQWEVEGRTGTRSISLSSTNGGDLTWRVAVAVEPDAVYRLSGWIRTAEVRPSSGRGAMLNVEGLAGAETGALRGTNDWEEVWCEFETGQRREVTVVCRFGGWGLATGKAWFDDVTLELLAQYDRTRPKAELDLLDETGTIEPYVYGQSLEPAGRYDYGGFWAEMLDDRKFFAVPGSMDSPWRRVGSEIGWSLTRDVERPYTGDGSVKITVTDRAVDELFGIQQGQLPIAAGREYVGHVVLAGRGSVKAILIWGDLPSERDTITIRLNQENYGRYPLRFQSGRTTADGVFAVGLESTGSVWIGAVSLMPADNVEGFKAEVLVPLKELGSPIYRWPGGMFASGYDWRDGIGPGDRRPPRRQRGSDGLESNDFGIDEFLTLCRLLDTEPLVVVNMGLGSPELAAALVQYCNGSAQTTWGRRRAANGRPEPYGVAWWGVGNGTYEDRQAGYVPLDPYLDRHSEFAEAMRAEDPKVKLVGVGRTGLWSEQMLERCGAMMDALGETVFISAHSELEEHVAAVPNAIRAKALAHGRYLETVTELGDRTIPMALQNWGYRVAPTEDAAAGAGRTLRDSLGIARGLHEMVRQAEMMRMAHYARIVHTGSTIPTLRMVTAFAATDLPFILYRHQFGTLGLRVTGRPVPLDVVAALTSDRRQATIGIVNPTTNSVQLELGVIGGTLGAQATRYLIAGDDPLAFNEHGQSPMVAIRESVVAEFDPKQILAPPLSVSLYVVSVRR